MHVSYILSRDTMTVDGFFLLIADLFEHFDAEHDCTLQISVGHTGFSQSVRFFTSRCLVTAYNGGLSPSYGLPKCPWPHLPVSDSNSSQLRNSREVISLIYQPTPHKN
jgi:hypothetical protein